MIREGIAIVAVVSGMATAAVIGQRRGQTDVPVPSATYAARTAVARPVARQTASYNGPPWLNGCYAEDEVRVTYIDGSSRCYAADDLGLEMP